jgi:hypothetical protein
MCSSSVFIIICIYILWPCTLLDLDWWDLKQSGFPFSILLRCWIDQGEENFYTLSIVKRIALSKIMLPNQVQPFFNKQ